MTHATLNFTENQGRAPELIEMIDQARSEGVDVSLDTYPYLPGCTTLAALLPSWASSGGPAETLRRLEDATLREKMRIAVEVTGCDGGHGIPTNWEEIQVSRRRTRKPNSSQVGSTSHSSIQAYSGRRISEIAQTCGVAPIQIFFEILQKDRLATSCIMHMGNEENVQAILQHETHTAGSDAILHGKSTHPRAYGTFPRFLGEVQMSIHGILADF